MSKYLLKADDLNKAAAQAGPPPPQVNIKRNLEVKQPPSSAATVSTASTDDTDTEKNDLARFYREAYCQEDVRMCETFAKILQLPLVTGEFVKPVLRSMKLLRLCDYTPEDLCCILAHAAVYFRQVYGLCGNDMDANEVGNVAATLLFIAHSYTQDEVCPLKIWHRHLFKKYCSMRLLNAAVFRLLRICRFRLRANDQEIQDAFRLLMVASGTPLPEYNSWQLPPKEAYSVRQISGERTPGEAMISKGGVPTSMTTRRAFSTVTTL